MNLKIKTILAVVLISVTISCKKADVSTEEVSDSVAADTTSIENNISSSAAAVDPDSDRKFVRTADLKFKVKNVAQSTTKIEDATRKFGGFVTYTNLESAIYDEEKNKMSSDSTLLVTKFTVENDITIRVPNTQLDTIIKTIAKEIDFLDHRIIRADDVTLQMLSNKMAQKRSQTTQDRLTNAIDKKGQKINQIVDAEDTLDQKKEQNDASKLQNASLNDQINFSTLTIKIYQDQSIKQKLIANLDNSDAYRPHIGIQIWDNIKSGWYLLESLLVFLIGIWPLFLLGGLGYFGYKKYGKK